MKVVRDGEADSKPTTVFNQKVDAVGASFFTGLVVAGPAMVWTTFWAAVAYEMWHWVT